MTDVKSNKSVILIAVLLGTMIATLLTAQGCAAKKTAADVKKKPTGPVKVLEGEKIPKYETKLVIPPQMPPTKKTGDVTEYEIAVRQFEQQILPAEFPKTTVWGYGRAGDPLPGQGKSTFNYPGYTIETRSNAKVRVKWVNGLVDGKGDYLKHILPLDTTIHWAMPDATAVVKMSMGPGYDGPVPIVTHLHGAHTGPESDGFPNAWYLPDAKNIPDGYIKQGPNYSSVAEAGAGAAWYEYPNTQRATTLWYHDHALGITRNNVYAGMAGFYLIRDDEEDALKLPGPSPKVSDKAGTKYYEIPLAIQDRTFNTDGSLFYPDTRAYFDEYKGPYRPETLIAPVWNPEFFGNAMVVNGKTWPYLEVEPRQYRFRLLNGCGARFLIVKFNKPGLQLTQIGSEGGLLPDAPKTHDQLLIAPAERADVLVDFSKFKDGDEIILQNIGPDEPYKGPNVSFEAADANTTGQIMKFIVKGKKGKTAATPAALPAIERLTTDLPARELTINELVATEEELPYVSKLGTGDAGPLDFESPITENPFVGDTEVWQIVNLTEDAHPIHLHMVMFQLVDRQPINKDEYQSAQEDALATGEPRQPLDTLLTGPSIGPNLHETGWKDTIVANPGEVTRVVARFDIPGMFVWHCHMLEHEDNEMMRPYIVNNR